MFLVDLKMSQQMYKILDALTKSDYLKYYSHFLINTFALGRSDLDPLFDSLITFACRDKDTIPKFLWKRGEF